MRMIGEQPSQNARSGGQEVMPNWAIGGGISPPMMDYDTTMEYRDNGVLCGVKRTTGGVSRVIFRMENEYEAHRVMLLAAQWCPIDGLPFFLAIPHTLNSQRKTGMLGENVTRAGVISR
ncbi:hypothetical protein DMENIID0001_058670 [Sergentomyia squamirostris]